MARKVSGRIKRAISSSLILFAVATVLAVSNAYVQNRDKQLALGPQSEAQLRFFVDGVDRPDISAFFKRLKSAEKLKIAQNLRRYQDPKMVRLAAIWLTDFDAEARNELGQALIDLAPKFPKELSDELKNTGGFQKLAVATALRKSQQATLPAVIDQLGVAANRANAVEYLVSVGKAAGPNLLPKLDDKDKPTQFAAADALGKIGYQPAGSKIRALYAAAEAGDKPTYLAALANLGERDSEPIFTQLLADPKTSSPDRANAILGLGRIATASSVETLWKEVTKSRLDKRQIIEALSLAGNLSLSDPRGTVQDRLEVAGGIQGPAGDKVIEKALENSATADRAAELSVGRPALTSALSQRLSSLNPDRDGDSIQRAIEALASTEPGKQALKSPALMSRFEGFIKRELSRRV